MTERKVDVLGLREIAYDSVLRTYLEVPSWSQFSAEEKKWRTF